MSKLESSDPIVVSYVAGLNRWSKKVRIISVVAGLLLGTGWLGPKKPPIGFFIAQLLISGGLLVVIVTLVAVSFTLHELSEAESSGLPEGHVLLLYFALAVLGVALGILGLVLS